VISKISFEDTQSNPCHYNVRQYIFLFSQRIYHVATMKKIVCGTQWKLRKQQYEQGKRRKRRLTEDQSKDGLLGRNTEKSSV